MKPQHLDDVMTLSLTTEIEHKIQDIVEDIRDLKDQMKASQHQLAYLLYQEADKQRATAASKIMLKNWWQYNETEEHYDLLCEHRENMFTWAAKEAGINSKDIGKFHYEHRRGRNLSPFTMVTVDSHYTKSKIMEWYTQTFDKKGWQEWTNDKLSKLTNGQNKPEVNGMIKFEPCIAGFDRMQTEPLKAIMAVITKLAPNLKWKHSWKHLTLQTVDHEEYLAWLALDHLEGIAKIYVDQEYFTARSFEDEFRNAFGNIMSKKTVGNKGKGKNKGGEGVLTPDDFLKAVGLGTEGKGSYFRFSTLALKTKVPFVFEVRSIEQSEFPNKYNEHLNRIAKRILQPDMVL
eukprot:Skav215883  [mRNA]  locus=scaffold956:40284:41321:- [translate_table: standard]